MELPNVLEKKKTEIVYVTTREETPEERIDAILARIDTLENYELTAWERVLKAARQSAMVDAFGQITELDETKFIKNDEREEFHRNAVMDIEIHAKNGLMQSTARGGIAQLSKSIYG